MALDVLIRSWVLGNEQKTKRRMHKLTTRQVQDNDKPQKDTSSIDECAA